jgi:hypothetical protein
VSRTRVGSERLTRYGTNVAYSFGHYWAVAAYYGRPGLSKLPPKPMRGPIISTLDTQNQYQVHSKILKREILSVENKNLYLFFVHIERHTNEISHLFFVQMECHTKEISSMVSIYEELVAFFSKCEVRAEGDYATQIIGRTVILGYQEGARKWV